MAYNKVWYHAGSPCNGCSGIGAQWAALDKAGIPFAVYSVEGAGLIVEASAYPGATLVYRMLPTDVALYGLSPQNAALAAWNQTMTILPQGLKALKARVWLEIGNEQDKGRADWLGRYYCELAALSLRDGYRLCGPGWATGEPEPIHWETAGWLAYLRLCADNPDRLAVTVHEYSLQADDITAESPWLVGRVKFLFDACDKHGIPHPPVFVTEAGWTHDDMPSLADAKGDIDWLSGLYATYPTVRAAFLWTLIGGGDKRQLAADLNETMTWLTDYSIRTRHPDPEQLMINLLKNPSFENGWTDATTFPGQHPQEWNVEWNVGDPYPNPHSGQPYLLGEGVHKSKALLPPAERDVFIWDGNWCYKLFAGDRCFWARMTQQCGQQAAGRYVLRTGIWTDCYRGAKDYNVEPRQVEMMVKVNGMTVADWIPLSAGSKHVVETLIDHTGGFLAVTVHMRCNWAINNNLFLDDWSLVYEPVITPPAPPTTGGYKVIVVKLPQDMTAEEWQRAAAYSYPYRHTMTASHDDMLRLLSGGNTASYVKLVFPERQADVIQRLIIAGYDYQAVVLPEVTLPFG